MIIKFRASKLKNHMNADVFAWNARLDSTLLSKVRIDAMENQIMANPMANSIRFIFANVYVILLALYIYF